ncbi:unnamed protein product, partial [Mesorhabditis spiculigera]
MAMFNNLLNMAQLFNMKPGQLLPSTSSSSDDDAAAPTTVAGLRRMIEAIGVEEFPDSLQTLLTRLDDLPDTCVAELAKSECESCAQTLPSLLALKQHQEDAHDGQLSPAHLEAFTQRLAKTIEESAVEVSNPGSNESRSSSRDDTMEPPEKKSRNENDASAGDATAQMMLNMMQAGFPFLQPNPFLPMDGFFNPLLAQQLKVLRQYFDINNSPTEAQIREMSLKTQLPEKVIKHWFRNTLFKERQRDKDSPYNFSIPPQMGIDLDMYEKTGETRVHPLTPEQINGSGSGPAQISAFPTVPHVEKEVKQEKLEEKKPAQQQPMNLQAALGAGAPNLAAILGSLQLRTLQQFFDKQAYPKDDDLELLSKKLQLSPRVIVVWFQNARQKARKIYENQPNLENSDRFVRTPGCNFQCKRCNLVFQRYYELIQHQQKKCYKDDCQAQLQDNKGVEGLLTDAEKEQLAGNPEAPPLSKSPALADPAELLKLLQGSGSTEALLKMCEAAKTPSTTTSSSDDQGDDIFSALAHNAMQSTSSQGESRSPANNKRYRTHLTPLQVHVMKCIFSEYKTPSMSECDTLGRDIGLHKRVVQVWFQNARAKERKTRVANGQDDDISRPFPTQCSYCNVEFSSRVSLQDHVFSQPHLTVLKSLHQGDETETATRSVEENGGRQRAPIVRDSSPKKGAAPLNAHEFPFNLLNFGLPQGSLPMVYDPSVMGTPIPLLQIPETVMTQITTDLSEGRMTTKFTQDGLAFEELISSLDEDDAKCAAQKNMEVGWACSRCTNVFQQEALLKSHQRTICSQAEGQLVLVQTHYECIPCGQHFGTQVDFKNHLQTDEHRVAKVAALFPTSTVTTSASTASPLASF